jgi:hypothetical protein
MKFDLLTLSQFIAVNTTPKIILKCLNSQVQAYFFDQTTKTILQSLQTVIYSLIVTHYLIFAALKKNSIITTIHWTMLLTIVAPSFYSY